MKWFIRYHSGESYEYESEEMWETEVEYIAENTPFDIDLDYVTHTAYIDDGDFDDEEDEWDNDWRDENGDF